MANILDRYGIKEVADVTFYELKDDGTPGAPALYLDTLKVSTIEQTAEEATATGGKGNAPLIVWDYGKEINVTLEDALFSAKSLAIMFGNGVVNTTQSTIKKTVRKEDIKKEIVESETVYYVTINKKKVVITVDTSDFYDEAGEKVTKGAEFDPTTASYAYCTFNANITNAGVIEVSANSFPGTYYVTGDTYARSEASGADEFFQFIIPKAKVQSENTITLEAEGDPSVFNMNLKVLRPKDGVMMKLVKYDLATSD